MFSYWFPQAFLDLDHRRPNTPWVTWPAIWQRGTDKPQVDTIILPKSPSGNDNWETGAASPFDVETQRNVQPGEDWLQVELVTASHIGRLVRVVGEGERWKFLGFRFDGMAVITPDPRPSMSALGLRYMDRRYLRLLPHSKGGWVGVSGAMPKVVIPRRYSPVPKAVQA
jgi:hypothetical protein